MATPIPKYRFHEPIRNLPGRSVSRGGEDRLGLHFARAYLEELTSSANAPKAALARQIPVNGYGIADVVAVSWNFTRPLAKVSCPIAFLGEETTTIFAFEVKLRDWRKALMQANRYRFFAHAAIVVLPELEKLPALKYLETFQLLDVGLWSVDPKTGGITKHFTPRAVRPPDTKHAVNALRHVAKVSKALPSF